MSQVKDGDKGKSPKSRSKVTKGQEELAELITAWPLLSPDLRVAILAIVRSADATSPPGGRRSLIRTT